MNDHIRGEAIAAVLLLTLCATVLWAAVYLWAPYMWRLWSEELERRKEGLRRSRGPMPPGDAGGANG